MATTQNYYKVKHGLEVPSQDTLQVTDSTLPTIRPSLLLDFANSKDLDPRITFTRASTATYYDGRTVAKAEENLLTFSQEFENSAWTNVGSTDTANSTAAPDGTITADTITEEATGSFHFIANYINNSVISGLRYTFSVFAKKGTGATAPDIIQLSWASISIGFATNVYANFNLSNGTVTSSGAGALSTSIINVGNGWYRCVLTADANANAAAGLGVFFVNNNGSATRAPSYTGATTSNVFVWGAQLEQRSAVTAYTPTTTQPITNYIPVLQTAASGVARFDHNPTTFESLGLLIEEQRTNLLTYSEQFDNAAWTKNQSSITANTIVAPDGTLTGDKLVENTANANHEVVSSVTITSSTTYTFSIYAKAAERTVIEVAGLGLAAQGFTPRFNLLTGAVTSAPSGSSMTLVGNGWWRCIVVVTASNTNAPIYRLFDTVTNTPTYTGDGYSGIYIWGADLEVGAFPTSYVKTEAAQVTRSADVAVMTGTNFSSWYRADEGTFYLDADMYEVQSTFFRYLLSVNTGSGVTDDLIGFIAPSNGNNVRGSVAAGGVSQAGLQTAITFNSMFKGGFAYKTNDFAASFNGGTPLTDTSGIVTAGVNRIYIAGASDNGGGVNSSTHIRKVAYYPARLPNATLQAITAV
jgi:hypothetical protein